MTNKANLDPVSNLSSQKISSPEESGIKNRTDILDDSDVSLSQTSYERRKAALSKREIMEQLSRERFPWDE